MFKVVFCAFSNSGCVILSGTVTGICLFLTSAACRAADTLETFDPGVSDFEIYAGYDGIGRPSADGTMGTASLLGIGIIERFSGYLSVAAASAADLSNAEGVLSTGIFGTPVDTPHFDLDLLLDVTVHGPGLSSIHILPILELNLDFSRFGFYFRGGGNFEGTPSSGPTGGTDRNLSILLNPGAYVLIGERHQLLVEYDAAVMLTGAGGYEQGGIALGYNITLSDRVELINQVSVGLPNNEDDISAGLVVGIIVSLCAGEAQ